MDIQESFRRILEQKQAVTHLFFSAVLGGCHEAHCVVRSRDWPGPVMDPFRSPQTLYAPLALYAQFANDLLLALREFHGADWSSELMEQWSLAIERVGQAIFAARQETVQSL